MTASDTCLQRQPAGCTFSSAAPCFWPLRRLRIKKAASAASASAARPPTTPPAHVSCHQMTKLQHCLCLTRPLQGLCSDHADSQDTGPIAALTCNGAGTVVAASAAASSAHSGGRQCRCHRRLSRGSGHGWLRHRNRCRWGGRGRHSPGEGVRSHIVGCVACTMQCVLVCL